MLVRREGDFEICIVMAGKIALDKGGGVASM